MYNICIWMNIPSHHQSAFFNALSKHDLINLHVVYLNKNSSTRIDEGWSSITKIKDFENHLNLLSPIQYLKKYLASKNFIHITNSYFTPELIRYFQENNTLWFHWSETPGYKIASLVNYNKFLLSLLLPLYSLYKRKSMKPVAQYALGAFAQGHLARSSFLSLGIGENKIFDLFYTPEPLKTDKSLKEISTFANGRKVFISVSSLSHRKGIDILIKAFSKIKNHDWCLVICGSDKSNGLYHSLVSKLGLTDRVLLLPPVSNDQISTVYCSGDVFILPSRFDGWGVVLNEAASLGLPIISTNSTGAAWHLIENGTNGFRINTSSTTALSSAMCFYCEQPDEIAIHGRKSKELLHSNFTPEKNVERLVNALGTLLSL